MSRLAANTAMAHSRFHLSLRGTFDIVVMRSNGTPLAFELKVNKSVLSVSWTTICSLSGET
jgi:hypothetical protein